MLLRPKASGPWKMLLLLLMQYGYDCGAGAASSLRQLCPPSVERISPQRRLRKSAKEATTLSELRGSTAMNGPE